MATNYLLVLWTPHINSIHLHYILSFWCIACFLCFGISNILLLHPPPHVGAVANTDNWAASPPVFSDNFQIVCIEPNLVETGYVIDIFIVNYNNTGENGKNYINSEAAREWLSTLTLASPASIRNQLTCICSSQVNVNQQLVSAYASSKVGHQDESGLQ